MNQLIIIGNGFDLAHGLRTKYNHFIEWYLKKAAKEHRQKHIFEDNLIAIHDRFGAPSNFQSMNLKEIRETLNNDLFRIDYKHKLFKRIVEESLINNWVDLESLYYSFLIDTYKEFEKHRKHSLEYIKNNITELNCCFEAIKDELIEYLKSLGISDEIKILEIENHLKNIFFDKKGVDQIMFLNFNYTPTLNLYSNLYNLNIVNIHGKINNEDNPIIFGYGDELDTNYEGIENLDNNEFLNYIKSFGYFKTENYKVLDTYINSGKFKVSIMGHSCGLSDRVLLNSIFEHDDCEEIKIFYHESGKDRNDHFEKTQQISRHFKSENKGKMRKKIFPENLCKPLVSFQG